MTADQLRQWRQSLPDMPNMAKTAKLLNQTPYNTYYEWETGGRRIPKILPLACLAISNGLELPPDWRASR